MKRCGVQEASGLLMLVQQKKHTGQGLSQHLRRIQSKNGKARLPWGYRTFLIKVLEELSCPGRNKTGKTWKSQSANVAKAAMLRGKAKRKWFFVNSMIKPAWLNQMRHVSILVAIDNHHQAVSIVC